MRTTIVSVALAFWANACGYSRSRALEVTDCDSTVSKFVTHWQVSTFGIDHSACVRMAIPSPVAARSVAASCNLEMKQFRKASYPSSHVPIGAMEWWDISEGADVLFASYARNGGDWEGYAYIVERQGGSQIWFICGSSL